MTERGQQLDGWLLGARLRARPEISPKSNYVQTLQQQQKVFRMRLWNEYHLVYAHAKRSHTHVKDPQDHVTGQSSVDYGNSKVRISVKILKIWSWILYSIQITDEEVSIIKLAAKNSESENILAVLLVQIYFNAFNLIMDTYRVRAPNLRRPILIL